MVFQDLAAVTNQCDILTVFAQRAVMIVAIISIGICSTMVTSLSRTTRVDYSISPRGVVLGAAGVSVAATNPASR